MRKQAIKGRIDDNVRPVKKQEEANNPESSESESDILDDGGEQLSLSEDSDISTEFATDEEDPDLPRISQWEPEDDPTPPPPTHNPLDKGEGPSRKIIKYLKKDLSSLPFQALLNARRKVEQSKDDSDSESDDFDEKSGVSEISEPEWTQNNMTEKTAWDTKKAQKRSNKHAPVEMSSKRPVSRKRQVTEVKKVNFRDPRFSPLSGELQPGSFQRRYAFLSDMHKNELTTLKENLKRAKKMLRSSPRDQREEREDEVQRLERAVKRTESSVNRDEREHVEREALKKALKEEKERRKAGKGEWHLKKSEKKDLLLRARHEALAQKGGSLAVKKAIEKKQKKISQKEKKQRPSFLPRSDRKDVPMTQAAGSKRGTQGDNQRSNKRRRML